MLRAFSPVTMARIATEDVELHGCPVKEGDRVVLNFAASNRDPAAFPNPDEVVIDRAVNRHLAFGAGIHRCAGSVNPADDALVRLVAANCPEFAVEIVDG